MTKCKKCKKETNNPKFCSKSCSASISNIGRNRRSDKKKQTIFCKKCNKKLLGKKKDNAKFCSHECHKKYQREENISKWLKTGTLKKSGGLQESHYVKVYLLEEQQNKCDICKQDKIWNNNNLVFILDHIDGNSQNNKRNNLRLICPNCDSQLPTFKSRNKGKGRHSRRIRYKNNLSY